MDARNASSTVVHQRTEDSSHHPPDKYFQFSYAGTFFLAVQSLFRGFELVSMQSVCNTSEITQNLLRCAFDLQETSF